MSTFGPLLSPVIVGRDDLVALAERRLTEVVGGSGHVLLLSGEAGIGKTRLIDAIAQLARDRGFRIAKGELAPQDRDVLAGSFLDLGRAMRRDPAFGDTGRKLLEVADARLNARIARRRDLVMELADLLAGPDVPTMLAFEDLQWADDLSLETLTEVARQSRTTPLLIVGAYRSNEPMGGSVLREWRSRLVTQRLAEEVRLARLSRAETALMTTLILGTGLPAPRDVVDAVHARTDGVPLHIEELCGALGRERLVDSRAILEAAVPETLEDATLARIARLTPDAGAVARAGAVVGRSFVPSVLAGIMNLPVEALDDPLDELVAHDVLDPDPAGGTYDFRHQLLRDALYRSVPARDRRLFHARAAEFGADLEGASDIHASVHFERAGMTDEAFRTALAAARRAMAISSHREAFELFRRAVDNMPAGLPDAERIGILLVYSDAASNIDRSDLSADLARRARELARRTGNHLGAIEGLANLAILARREGEGVAYRRDLSRQLNDEIEAAPAGPELVAFRVFSLQILALVEFDDCRFAEAKALLLEARELAAAHGEAPDSRWLDNYLAQFEVINGRAAEGLDRIRAIGESVRADGHEDIGVGCYRDATLFGIRAMDYRAASVGLAEGLRYAESVEQSFCGHWLQSAEAFISWADGRWDDAVRQGGQSLSDPGSGGSRMFARWALGYVEATRGRREAAEGHLLPALDYARHAEQLDLMLPAMWGLAEAALCAGAPERAAELAEDALREARSRGEWLLIAPFAVTGVRALQAAGRPDAASRFLDEFLGAIGPGEPIAKPAILHATGLVRLADGSIVAGREALEAAVTAWDARGRAWEGLWARLDLAGALLRSSRFAEAMTLIREVGDVARRLESEPLIARADHLLRVARGRGEEHEPWAPLTTREFEVARKVAEGMTNAELAGELGISPKTASSHVEHILAKLGVSRRAEIATWVATVRVASEPGRAVALR